MKQEKTETVDQFVTWLMQQAIFCDFGDRKEEKIRDQVIDKSKSLLLFESFLEK